LYRTFRKIFGTRSARVSDHLERDIDPHPHPLGDARRGLDQPMPSSAGAADAVELARRSGVTERLGERTKEQPRAGGPVGRLRSAQRSPAIFR
jgi:hypothetical protein